MTSSPSRTEPAPPRRTAGSGGRMARGWTPADPPATSGMQWCTPTQLLQRGARSRDVEDAGREALVLGERAGDRRLRHHAGPSNIAAALIRDGRVADAGALLDPVTDGWLAEISRLGVRPMACRAGRPVRRPRRGGRAPPRTGRLGLPVTTCRCLRRSPRRGPRWSHAAAPEGCRRRECGVASRTTPSGVGRAVAGRRAPLGSGAVRVTGSPVRPRREEATCLCGTS